VADPHSNTALLLCGKNFLSVSMQRVLTAGSSESPQS
jgi:hypothetical protein